MPNIFHGLKQTCGCRLYSKKLAFKKYNFYEIVSVFLFNELPEEDMGVNFH